MLCPKFLLVITFLVKLSLVVFVSSIPIGVTQLNNNRITCNNSEPCNVANLTPTAHKSEENSNEISVSEHLQRVNSFNCSLPQLTAICVSDFFPSANVNGKQYSPKMTVLHRCVPGCGVCTPVQTQVVTLTFRVEQVIPDGLRHNGSVSYETVLADDHVLCDCQMQTQ